MKGKKLPGKAAIGLIVGGDLLLLLVGWFLLIGPQRATAASITQATAAVEAQLVEAKRPVVKVKPPSAIVQPEIETADLYSLAKAMPSEVDQPNLLLELDQIARDAGIDVTTISFGTAQEDLANGFSTVTINVTFTGDFYSITDYLYRLRSLVTVRNGALQTSGRLFSVGTIGLTPAGTGSSKLSANVAINAYVFGGGVAPPAPVAPVATGTDTTSTETTPAPSSDVAP
jgi:Tfp pilus assembly protein PilO